MHTLMNRKNCLSVYQMGKPAVQCGLGFNAVLMLCPVGGKQELNPERSGAVLLV